MRNNVQFGQCRGSWYKTNTLVNTYTLQCLEESTVVLPDLLASVINTFSWVFTGSVINVRLCRFEFSTRDNQDGRSISAEQDINIALCLHILPMGHFPECYPVFSFWGIKRSADHKILLDCKSERIQNQKTLNTWEKNRNKTTDNNIYVNPQSHGDWMSHIQQD